MEKEDAKKLIPIIEAYGDGRDVEWFDGHMWQTGTHISFSDKPENYRIKPQSKLIPFTFEDKDLFKDKWFRLKTTGGLFKASYIDESLITIGASQNSYSELMQLFEFEDGSPCGKYINE